MLKNIQTIRIIDPSFTPASSLLQHCTSLETEITFGKGAKGDPGTNGTQTRFTVTHNPGSFDYVVSFPAGTSCAATEGCRRPLHWSACGDSRASLLALEAAGLAAMAVRGVIVAINEFTEWWFAVFAAVGLALLVYLLLVWKQHQYRASRLGAESDNPMERSSGK